MADDVLRVSIGVCIIYIIIDSDINVIIILIHNIVILLIILIALLLTGISLKANSLEGTDLAVVVNVTEEILVYSAC